MREQSENNIIHRAQFSSRFPEAMINTAGFEFITIASHTGRRKAKRPIDRRYFYNPLFSLVSPPHPPPPTVPPRDVIISTKTPRAVVRSCTTTHPRLLSGRDVIVLLVAAAGQIFAPPWITHVVPTCSIIHPIVSADPTVAFRDDRRRRGTVRFIFNRRRLAARYVRVSVRSAAESPRPPTRGVPVFCAGEFTARRKVTVGSRLCVNDTCFLHFFFFFLDSEWSETPVIGFTNIINCVYYFFPDTLFSTLDFVLTVSSGEPYRPNVARRQ